MGQARLKRNKKKIQQKKAEEQAAPSEFHCNFDQVISREIIGFLLSEESREISADKLFIKLMDLNCCDMPFANGDIAYPFMQRVIGIIELKQDFTAEEFAGLITRLSDFFQFNKSATVSTLDKVGLVDCFIKSVAILRKKINPECEITTKSFGEFVTYGYKVIGDPIQCGGKLSSEAVREKLFEPICAFKSYLHDMLEARPDLFNDSAWLYYYFTLYDLAVIYEHLKQNESLTEVLITICEYADQQPTFNEKNVVWALAALKYFKLNRLRCRVHSQFYDPLYDTYIRAAKRALFQFQKGGEGYSVPDHIRVEFNSCVDLANRDKRVLQVRQTIALFLNKYVSDSLLCGAQCSDDPNLVLNEIYIHGYSSDMVTVYLDSSLYEPLQLEAGLISFSLPVSTFEKIIKENYHRCEPDLARKNFVPLNYVKQIKKDLVAQHLCQPEMILKLLNQDFLIESHRGDFDEGAEAECAVRSGWDYDVQTKCFSLEREKDRYTDLYRDFFIKRLAEFKEVEKGGQVKISFKLNDASLLIDKINQFKQKKSNLLKKLVGRAQLVHRPSYKQALTLLESVSTSIVKNEADLIQMKEKLAESINKYEKIFSKCETLIRNHKEANLTSLSEQQVIVEREHAMTQIDQMKSLVDTVAEQMSSTANELQQVYKKLLKGLETKPARKPKGGPIGLQQGSQFGDLLQCRNLALMPHRSTNQLKEEEVVKPNPSA